MYSLKISKLFIIGTTAAFMVACNRGDDKLVVGDNTPVEAIMAAGKKESLAGKGTKAGDYYL